MISKESTPSLDNEGGNKVNDADDIAVPDDIEIDFEEPNDTHQQKDYSDINTVELIDEMHWIFNSRPKPLTLKKIGYGKKCQMPGCDQDAFITCNNALHWLYMPCLPEIWSGCNRYLCPNHVAINYNKLTGQPAVWHCRFNRGDVDVNVGFKYNKPAYTDCGLRYNTSLCKTLIHYIIFVLSPLYIVLICYMAIKFNQFPVAIEEIDPPM